MWPVALIPVTDRIPLVKSMKASVKRTEVLVSPLRGPIATNSTEEASVALTVVEPEDGGGSSEGAEKLGDDVEGELPDLQLPQNHHRQRHGGVHVAPWGRRRQIVGEGCGGQEALS